MFEIKGDRAQWVLVYDALAALEVGKILTYEELDAILKRDFREDRSPIYRAIRQLEIEDRRTVVSVRSEGYRVIEAREHEALARHHHKKSRRQLGKAVDKAASANRSALTADERKRMDGLEMNLRQHSQMIRRLEQRDEQRQSEIKSLRRDTSTDFAEMSERLDHLEDLLTRHGKSSATPSDSSTS